MSDKVKIVSIENCTHDVLKITAEKPHSICYQPGQAVDVSINKPGWEQELRAFTFTSLQEDDYIEFTIKTYPAHNGVTAQMRTLQVGDELIIGGVFGDIAYKGEGVFIAGGAGITPFIAIFKDLARKQLMGNNTLLFANKTKADIIDESRFASLLGNRFINVLSDENRAGYEHGFISSDLIQKHQKDYLKYYYLCGPEPMMNAVEEHLAGIGVKKEQIIREGF